MNLALRFALIWFAFFVPYVAHAAQSIVDIPTRPGVTMRAIVVAPDVPKAAAILLAGGHGGLQIASSGTIGWGKGNFVIRNREAFAGQGLFTISLDAPSDRQKAPFLGGFRQTPDHVADLAAVIAWIRNQHKVPVWLIGTSRGTQSAAYVATQLTGPEGPDGIVLTSSILRDSNSRALPRMELAKIRIPVLVAHHEHDGCALCAYSDLPPLMDGLVDSRRKDLLTMKGGRSDGDPCEPGSYHGFNGLDGQIVPAIARWILAD